MQKMLAGRRQHFSSLVQQYSTILQPTVFYRFNSRVKMVKYQSGKKKKNHSSLWKRQGVRRRSHTGAGATMRYGSSNSQTRRCWLGSYSQFQTVAVGAGWLLNAVTKEEMSVRNIYLYYCHRSCIVRPRFNWPWLSHGKKSSMASYKQIQMLYKKSATCYCVPFDYHVIEMLFWKGMFFLSLLRLFRLFFLLFCHSFHWSETAEKIILPLLVGASLT